MTFNPDWLVAPAIAATENSKHKCVRALGQIATFTILLPWLLVTGIIGAICAGIMLTVAAGIDWWRNV